VAFSTLTERRSKRNYGPFSVRTRRRGTTHRTEITLDGELVVAFERGALLRVERVGPTAGKLVAEGHYRVLADAVSAAAQLTPDERIAFEESFRAALGKTFAELPDRERT
jgi:hypothetical protein